MSPFELATRLVVTDNIILEELQEEHAAILFDSVDRNRAHLREWLPWLDHVQQVDDSLQFIRRQQQLRAQRQEFVLGIFVQGELAGCLATHLLDWSHRKTTLGYWLGQEFTKQGLMDRCCRRLLEYLFDELRLHRVGLHCATDNRPSRRVAERLGFCEEGILRDHEWLYNRFVDQVVYRLLDSEFPRERSG